jgi:hypothetical protein
MRWKRLLMVTALAAGAAGPAAAQAARTEAQMRAGPRDIREAFLAVPFPEVDFIDNQIPLDSTLATYARRRAVLNAALARGGPNVLDLRNGYLKLRLPSEIPGDDSLELVMTYFNRDDGRRLVVMQAARLDPDSGEPRWSIDHFWWLAGGSFTPVYWDDVLPALDYWEFWGDRPLPERYDRFFQFFPTEVNPVHTEWPRQGTIARLRMFTPHLRADGDDEYVAFMGPLAEFIETRRFGAIELRWDRRRGVFAKGAKTPYEPDEEHHHH